MGLSASLQHFGENSVVNPLVAAGYRVIRFDNRDCGKSSSIPVKPADPAVSHFKYMFSNGCDAISSLFSSSSAPALDEGPIDVSTDIDHDLSSPISPVPGKAPLPEPLQFNKLAKTIGLAPPQPVYHLSDMAVDAWKLLDALHIDRAHLVGVSMGGMICQYMAALQPSRTRSLALVMTSTYNRKSELSPSLPFLLKLFVARKAPTPTSPPSEWADHITAGNEIIGHQDPNRTFNGGAPMRQFADTVVEHGMNPEGSLRQMAAVNFGPCRDEMLSWVVARVPTVIIHGTKDFLVPTANAHHMFDIAHTRYKSTGNEPVLIHEEEERGVTKEVAIDNAVTRLHLLTDYAHDLCDGFSDVMCAKLIKFYDDVRK